MQLRSLYTWAAKSLGAPLNPFWVFYCSTWSLRPRSLQQKDNTNDSCFGIPGSMVEGLGCSKWRKVGWRLGAQGINTTKIKQAHSTSFVQSLNRSSSIIDAKPKCLESESSTLGFFAVARHKLNPKFTSTLTPNSSCN